MYSSFPKERDINYMKSNNMPTDYLHIIFLKNAFMSILKGTVACACACYSSAMDIPPDPNQPKTFKFPQHSFGVKNPVKSFQASWFANRTWLHYDETNDLAFCHVCLVAYKDGKLKSNTIDKAFIVNGYSNWNDASVSFRKHESSNCHRESVLKVVTLPNTTEDIGETLSTQHNEDKINKRDCLLKILSSLRFLGRQGQPIRGDGDESDGNYIQLLTLRGKAVFVIVTFPGYLHL